MAVDAVRQVQQDLGKDVYLRLFAAQAQNQNPLDPVKGEQFLADLAQFGALEQMTNVNANFEKLLKEIAEIKATRQTEQLDLSDLTQAERASGWLAELRAAEGMLDREVTFIDPETGESVASKVKAVIVQNGMVRLETGDHSLSVTDVLRIEA